MGGYLRRCVFWDIRDEHRFPSWSTQCNGALCRHRDYRAILARTLLANDSSDLTARQLYRWVFKAPHQFVGVAHPQRCSRCGDHYRDDRRSCIASERTAARSMARALPLDFLLHVHRSECRAPASLDRFADCGFSSAGLFLVAHRRRSGLLFEPARARASRLGFRHRHHDCSGHGNHPGSARCKLGEPRCRILARESEVPIVLIGNRRLLSRLRNDGRSRVARPWMRFRSSARDGNARSRERLRESVGPHRHVDNGNESAPERRAWSDLRNRVWARPRVRARIPLERDTQFGVAGPHRRRPRASAGGARKRWFEF